MTTTKKKAAPKKALPKRRHVATGRPKGRPSEYTEQHKDEIINRLADGQNLREVCRMEGMPNWATVYYWVENDEAFSQRFARARVLGFDAIAHDSRTIAYTPQAGERTKTFRVTEIRGEGEDEREVIKETVETYSEDMLGHRKLIVETNLKLLSRWDPARYGEKVGLTGANGGPLQILMTQEDVGVV